MNIIEAIEQDYKRDDIPEFGVGDTLKVYIKIKEGNRERIQMFEGFVLKNSERRSGQDLYRQKDLFRRRCGKDFPYSLSDDRKSRSDKARRCKKS